MMGRWTRNPALLLAAPFLLISLACGDGADPATHDEDAVDRQLDLAFRGDTVVPAFEDGERAPRPRTMTMTVPMGTTLAMRMNEELSTETSHVGDAFTATLSGPVVDGAGALIIPSGATVRGRVTAVSHSTRVGQSAVMHLAFEAVSFDGQSFPLQATVERADVRERPRTTAGQQATRVAAGAAAGAVVGRVIGRGTESTVHGAVIGAAAGTAIAMGTADVDAVLPRGAELVIRLDQAIHVTRTVIS